MIAIAGIVGDDGQFASALVMQGFEQMIGNTDSAKSGHQYRRPVAHPGYGVGGGLYLLVDHVKGLPCAALSFGVRGLWRNPSGRK